MFGCKKLRKENEALRNSVRLLEGQLWELVFKPESEEAIRIRCYYHVMADLEKAAWFGSSDNLK